MATRRARRYVRQLRNEMDRLVGIIDPGGTIRPGDLDPETRSSRRTQPTVAGSSELLIRPALETARISWINTPWRSYCRVYPIIAVADALSVD